MPRSGVASCPLKIGIIREGLSKQKVTYFLDRWEVLRFLQLLFKATGDSRVGELGSPC